MPAPIAPLTQLNRSAPQLEQSFDLIDFNDSPPVATYPRAKASRTSKFIVQFLEDYESKQNDVSMESINVSPGFELNQSDEKFGKLVFSDDSD